MRGSRCWTTGSVEVAHWWSGAASRDAPADTCFAAVALPSASDRIRIAISFADEAIVRTASPLRLDEVIAAAPTDRRPALDHLRARAATIGTTLHVYGSFAWQAICGEACVTPSSDLDLLWDARDANHAATVIATLRDWESTHGLRADGEARFADGGAVAWRELASSAARVLVKRDDGVALESSPLRTAPVTA